MKYVLKKLIFLLITLFLVSIFTFTAFQVIPGDNVMLRSASEELSEESILALRQEFGLDRTPLEQYFFWLSRALCGDFGDSLQYNRPVSTMILGRLPVTVGLAVVAILMVILISIPLGIWAARHENCFIDRVIRFFCQVGMAIPPFFLGIMIILLFGIILRFFQVGRYVSYTDNFGGFLYFLLFPALAIAIPKSAMIIKFLRTSLLRQLSLDYVRTARSKGSSENRVFYVHVLKNALIPVVTFLAMVFADVLAGSIVVEQVFSLPGIGRLLVVAISNRDFPIVQAVVLYIAVVVILINFAVDLIYRRIDPRVKLN